MNETESKTQARVLKLFQHELDFAYYGNLHHQINGNIIVEKLTASLSNKAAVKDLPQKRLTFFCAKLPICNKGHTRHIRMFIPD